MRLKLKSSQRIVDEKNQIVMAEGRMVLLEHIVQTGSINRAAKLMGMSYKSAWSKLRSTEAHLGTKIVQSDKSRGTRLTPAGVELLQNYKKMKRQCLVADDAAFADVFHSTGRPLTSFDQDGQSVRQPPIVSFVGYSDCGKTTFIEKLIPILAAAGLKVAVIKHDVHGFEMDKPGKDTWRHKKAGAVATVISSPNQIGMVMDADHDHSPEELAGHLGFADLIITEGYKSGACPKVEIFRPRSSGENEPICRNDPRLLALVSDIPFDLSVPVFGTDQAATFAAFLMQHFQLTGASSPPAA